MLSSALNVYNTVATLRSAATRCRHLAYSKGCSTHWQPPRYLKRESRLYSSSSFNGNKHQTTINSAGRRFVAAVAGVGCASYAALAYPSLAECRADVLPNEENSSFTEVESKVDIKETTATMSTHDVLNLTTVKSATISPCGTYLAFIVSSQVPPGKTSSELKIVRVEDYRKRRDSATVLVVSGTTSMRRLEWSQDGERLYFCGKNAEFKSRSVIFFVNPGASFSTTEKTGVNDSPSEAALSEQTGSVDEGKGSIVSVEPALLFKHSHGVRGYSVSPCGRYVAFTTHASSSARDKARKSGGHEHVVFEEDDRDVDLLIADLEEDSMVPVPVKGIPRGVAYSPDGRSLSFYVAPSVHIDDWEMKSHLCVVDISTKSIRYTSRNAGKIAEHAWSPDSRRILYRAGYDEYDPACSHLWLVELERGTTHKCVHQLGEVSPSTFEWIDNDSGVLLVNAGCNTNLCYAKIMSPVDLESTASISHRVLASSNDPPGMVFRSVTLANVRDNIRLGLIADCPRHPREAYVLDVSKSDLIEHSPSLFRVTHSNDLSKFKLGDQKIVSYKARDGVLIEGILLYPTDWHDPGKQYRRPLIVQVHGGPESHVSNGWVSAYNNPGNVGAGKGYFVFYINYRGSTGRGMEFSKLGQGRPAQEEFDDIVDGIDFLIEQEFVDRERVGITGGSYGGYASAWAATKLSHRFAAAVMSCGISNQLSKATTSDIPEELFYSHLHMRMEGNHMKFLEASPIYYVSKAKTPILIAHGTNDTRVPFLQSLELYRALKMQGGVPVRLVAYKGEGHGYSKYSNKLDYGLRQMEWFDHFLVKRKANLPEVDPNYNPTT